MSKDYHLLLRSNRFENLLPSFSEVDLICERVILCLKVCSYVSSLELKVT